MVVPLRTQNLGDFSRDFFLPTFVNLSLKIHNTALKIIASVFAVALDILTFPVRLLTSPFRAYYNHTHPEPVHPIESPDGPLGYPVNGDQVTLRWKVGAPKDGEGEVRRGSLRVAIKRIPDFRSMVSTSEKTRKKDAASSYGNAANETYENFMALWDLRLNAQEGV